MAPPQFFVAGRKLLVDGRAAIDGIRVDLDFSAGSVSGRAIVAAGNPIPDARVVLQSVDSQKLGVDADSKVYSAPAGIYKITGVAPGEYFLFAWRGDPALIGDPDLFAKAREQARRVKVEPREESSQDAMEMENR
jgi:hypothetical protein